MKNLTELNEYCIENLGMELLSMEEKDITTVKEVITSALRDIKTEKSCKDNIKSMLEMIESLKEFADFNCLYIVDCMSGGTFGQGFVIIDSKGDYKGFVRTI
ncbi:hypothetical protein [Clostridium estertheticum]|uniref:Uncharacterized protein n=1 Tax=Clostridium estertheticum TaxID=238834 RepID=A0AA47EIL6_9CLOT|nr:hypothetical protein [Clostridium estertheticum]MBU3153485.1 hypothetical protein [Clostridium estertheticum]WAG60887.1 hypothetical protein LL038_01145 [Clostridium estertheticum]